MIALLVGGPANGEVRQLQGHETQYHMRNLATAYWVSDDAPLPVPNRTIVYRKVPAAKGPNGETVFLVQE